MKPEIIFIIIVLFIICLWLWTWVSDSKPDNECKESKEEVDNTDQQTLDYLYVLSEELTDVKIVLGSRNSIIDVGDDQYIIGGCLEGSFRAMRLSIRKDKLMFVTKKGIFKGLSDEDITILIGLLLENPDTIIEDKREWMTEEVKALNKRVQERLES